mmetsp:Transcript_9356/g.25212  ORF Transcript_9356/g.25212 Transcript_9356/m.25212 type:complete len:228 (-) Transcript_9356:950-1633(-)
MRSFSRSSAFASSPAAGSKGAVGPAAAAAAAAAAALEVALLADTSWLLTLPRLGSWCWADGRACKVSSWGLSQECSSWRVMLSSSCSCPGLLSLACLPLASLYFWKSDSRGSAVVCSLSFCLGVRSPCLMTASTQRSSSFSERWSVRAISASSMHEASSPSRPSSGSSASISSAASSCSRPYRWLWLCLCTLGLMEEKVTLGVGMAARCWGATAPKIMLRKMPAESS